MLGYEALIQPILDRNCVRCHSPEKCEGGLDFTAAKDDTPLNRSFRTLFPQKKGSQALVSVANRFSGSRVTQPKEFGSHKSQLVLILLNDALHQKESKLSEPEWKTLTAWVDANAPYYDTFYNKRPDDGGPPRRVQVDLDPPFAHNQ